MLGSRYRGDVRGKFFTQRVVGEWNWLPAVVVEADSLGSFKRLLDKYMEISKMGGLQVSLVGKDMFGATCGPKGLFVL